MENRNSLVAMAKRNSAYLVPMNIIDPRASWTGHHGQPGQPPAPSYPSSNIRRIEEDELSLTRAETNNSLKDDLEVEEKEDVVLGSTEIFDKDGNIRLVPTPTPDPKDPLNLSEWRKWLAVASMCFFGSISLAAEIAIAGLTPVFLLEYSGVDPASALKHADLKGNPDPLAVIPPGVQPVSLAQVSLLATIPLLSNGFATYLLVPLSTAIGRRPVLILTSTLSWASGFWAGASMSLTSHIAARVFHGLGSGAVEALLPLIVQDIMFIHQRNKAVAAIIAAQGPMIITFGILAPWISVNYTWRWVYYITSAIGIFAWFFLIAFVPESRRQRSKAELAGQQLWPVEPGESRTKLDYVAYGRRTKWDDLGFFQYGYEWKEGASQILATAKTTFFPAVIFCTLLQTAFGIVMGASGQAVSFALLAAGIPFELTGLSNLTQIVSTIAVFVIGGALSDKVTMWISKRRGSREPEYQLINLITPIVFAIIGAIVFGYADQFHLHYMVLLLGQFFLMTSPLMAAPIINNYVIESYPQWAGAVLTNVSVLRIFTSFYFNTQVTTWISQLGPLKFMSYIAVALLVVSSGIPLLFVYGKKLRSLTSGKVKKTRKAGSKWGD
ncbi:hypothetical protein LA080_006234 [Diaporthe eres]|uniref:Major facilitator superfamily (MFS) profile domain-containing protein n=1 Tax=Diaporthe vaccinii TaxID=105482 RepID=A0ABR4DYL4_9PEZI|nr:hypothetical protein LA080_006234 [Diaporthe eres]